jgi:dihydropteroate synthase
MWKFRNGQTLTWGAQTYVMGVLNVTPDSFSDGGQFNTLETAMAQAQHMVAAGADILDVGGQSTRPQADIISMQEELDRVVPVIQALRSGQGLDSPITIPISIDTTRAAVARAAIAAGADIINDISGGQFDPELLPTVAELGVPVILMHSRGTPKTMQQLTDYDDLIPNIIEFLSQQIERAIALGIPKDHLAIDPGVGFAKTYGQNLEILRRLADFQAIGCPILVGTSRKSFIGHILNQPDPQQRVWGTAATCCVAIAHGADIVRVHDVKEMRDVCRVADAIYRRR